MDLTLYLILAHFLADYPLQSNWLAKYKLNHLLGIFLHSLTHFIVSVILMIPFLHLASVWWGIIIVFVTHNFFDQIKVILQKKTKLHPLFLYGIDQVAHLAVIYWVSVFYVGEVSSWFSGFWFALYADPSIISFFLILTLVTYFYDISRWIYLSAKKPILYKRDYKMMGRNALIVLIAFVVYWVTR